MLSKVYYIKKNNSIHAKNLFLTTKKNNHDIYNSDTYAPP